MSENSGQVGSGLSIPELIKAARVEVQQRMMAIRTGTEKYLQNTAALQEPKQISSTNSSAHPTIPSTPEKKPNARQLQGIQATASTEHKEASGTEIKPQKQRSHSQDRFLSATSSPKRNQLSVP